MTRLHFHAAARIELDAARRYYRTRNAEVARRFSAELLRLFRRIAEDPSQFPEHGLVTVPSSFQTLFFSVRRAVLLKTFPYVVFYYARQGGIVVLAVAHTSRRPGYWAHRS